MTDGTLSVFVQLLVIFVFARFCGVGAIRLRLPASVGELSAGVLLGVLLASSQAAWPQWNLRVDPGVLVVITDAAVFFLILFAGVQLQPKEIVRNSPLALGVALGGIALPLLGGVAIVMGTFPESDLRPVQALVAGIILSITSIPAAIKILSEIGALRTRVGETIVAAALFDDVIGLFLIAVIASILKTGALPQATDFALMLGKITIFFGVTALLGARVYPPIQQRISALQIASLEFSALIIVALTYGVMAELLGLHWILGAFAAGLYFESSRVGQAAYDEMNLMLGALSAGVMGPLFFASIGLRVDLSAFIEMPGLVASLILVGFLGKLFGAGLPARLGGLPPRDALAIGAGMSSRGAVELIILSLAVQAGVFFSSDGGDAHARHFYSAAVIMVIVCTSLSAMLLGLLGRQRDG